LKRFRSKISHTYHKCDCSAVKSGRNAVGLLKSKTAKAATQRNKRQLLYFSRMAQQQAVFVNKLSWGFILALANRENAI